jgi:hypothetical protein
MREGSIQKRLRFVGQEVKRKLRALPIKFRLGTPGKLGNVGTVPEFLPVSGQRPPLSFALFHVSGAEESFQTILSTSLHMVFHGRAGTSGFASRRWISSRTSGIERV